VAERDGNRCSFVGAEGHRCDEVAWIELHHRIPFAQGGDSSVENLELRCKRHNQYQAELDYGAALIEARRRQRDLSDRVREGFDGEGWGHRSDGPSPRARRAG